MRCPYCGSSRKSQVIDSRSTDGGQAIRRRRKCPGCGGRFTTYEHIEAPRRLLVVKRDGTRIPFDREKLMAGLEKACYKRPVSIEEIRKLSDAVEEDIFKRFDREVDAVAIAEAAAGRLRLLDQVAYVRFASVYKQFRDLDDLIDEVRHIQSQSDHDDRPGQGKLF